MKAKRIYSVPTCAVVHVDTQSLMETSNPGGSISGGNEESKIGNGFFDDADGGLFDGSSEEISFDF